MVWQIVWQTRCLKEKERERKECWLMGHLHAIRIYEIVKSRDKLDTHTNTDTFYRFQIVLANCFF